MEIRSAPAPATKVDPAPKAAPRDNPAEIAAERSQPSTLSAPERRRADRRRAGEGRKPVIERRMGAERRRRSVDISV